MGFNSCPRCQNNNHGTLIYKCYNCNILFCSVCDGGGIISTHCPRCDSSSSHVGYIENQYEVQRLKEEERKLQEQKDIRKAVEEQSRLKHEAEMSAHKAKIIDSAFTVATTIANDKKPAKALGRFLLIMMVISIVFLLLMLVGLTILRSIF